MEFKNFSLEWHLVSYSNVLLNDKGTFWEIHNLAPSSSCEHNRVCWHKPRLYTYYTPRLYGIPLLYMQFIFDQIIIMLLVTVFFFFLNVQVSSYRVREVAVIIQMVFFLWLIVVWWSSHKSYRWVICEWWILYQCYVPLPLHKWHNWGGEIKQLFLLLFLN